MRRLITIKAGFGLCAGLALRLAAAESAGPGGPGSSSPAHSGAGETPSGVGFDAFRIIFERNIFNPNRSSHSPDLETTRREPEPRVRTESFALVGTMTHENGRFAFFDSPSPDYRKVLRLSEGIAGFKIAAVTPNHVTLKSTNDGEIKLPVGMQLQRQDEGRWTLGERTEALSPEPRGISGSSNGGGTASAAGAAGSESDEVLRRMMQRREQEGGAASSSPVAPAVPAVPSPPASSLSPRSTTAAPTSAGEEEIIRRMLEKREQELKK